MDVKNYTVEFVHRQPYIAQCSEFIGWSIRPQIHVWLRIGNKLEIFNFYKLPDELFWFELLPPDERLAYRIALVLGKKFNLRVEKRNGIQMEI